MWWRALITLCALGLVTTAALPATVSPPSDRAVVIATLPCRPSLQATSTGFLIDDELVMTVAHAIYDSRDFAIRDSSGEWHRPEIVHMDLDRDLAVLRVPGLEARPMMTRQAATDERVRMIEGAASGSSDGAVLRRVRLTTETIGDLTQTNTRSGYELSVAIKGGDSGAAVVDSYGNLIGIVFARSTRREAAWVTAASEIVDALERDDVPSWECERPSDVELILETPNLDEQPDELAAPIMRFAVSQPAQVSAAS